MSTRLRSFSKINLGLAVGPPRPDGFHALATVYQTLPLHDLVTVVAQPATHTSIQITSNHPGVPRTEASNAERNTAWKMIRGALERLRLCADVQIHIEKILPVQGGMGAGSANAVAALLGLERELGLALPGPERLQLAAEVGSDVPLFLLGGTVLGLGRGEQVYPLPDSPPMSCVVALPQIGVSTALAFQQIDADSLTSGRSVDKLERLSRALSSVFATSGLESGPSGIALLDRSVSAGSVASRETLSQDQGAGDLPSGRASATREVQSDLAENPLLALVRTGIENDFEEVVFSQHPFLRSIKRDLLGSSRDTALYAALSGSGSALFGLYGSRTAAREAQHRVQQNGTRAILTETLPRHQYRRTIFAEEPLG
ncbi:MAG: 4-(cytidine 5'-diphospho)-2-C-methyl-D-erythritol kinase [Acidobacteriaceae bacterium]